MTKKLKRIAPLQLAKVLGVLYAIGSLVTVPFFLLFSALASLAPQTDGSPSSMPLMLGMGLGFILVAPILYGFVGFISGLIGAFLYNLVAGWVGGIELDFEDSGSVDL